MKILNDLKENLYKDNITYDFNNLVNIKDIYLIFLASWCPVTDSIILNLKEFYKSKNKNGMNVELIMIPYEDNKDEYRKFCTNIPWVIIEFNTELISNIFDDFDIKKIPNFIKINKELQVIEKFESIKFYIDNLKNF